MSKPRVIKNYESLSVETQEQVKLADERRKRAWGLTTQAELEMSKLNFSGAGWRLETALELNPTGEAYYKRGVLHFVRKEFKQALECFQLSQNERASKLVALIEDMELLDGPLEREKLLEVFERATGVQKKIGLYFLKADGEASKLQEHAQFVAEVLAFYNELDEVRLEYNEDRQMIDLSNNPNLSIISVPFSANSIYHLFHTLPARRVNLSNTAVDGQTVATLRQSMHVIGAQ